MLSVPTSNATVAPFPPHSPQAARIAGRVRISPALADVIAFHAFGARRRDDDVLLVAITSARVAAHAEARS